MCLPRPSHAADLTLAWDAPSDGVATGYIVFYGTASHSYSSEVNVGNTTSYIVNGLSGGTTYYFAVRAYDATGAISELSNEVSTTIAPSLAPVVTALELTANVSAPQVAGTSVTWLSTATGGVAPYQFQWSLYGAGEWTTYPWTDASTWTWRPLTPGSDYQIRVAVRSSGNSSLVGEMVQSVPFTVTAPLAVTLQPDVSWPQTVGRTIRWSAVASGGTGGEYEYFWWEFNGSVWRPMVSWTTRSTWDWTPEVPNHVYIVALLVRSVGSLTGAPEAFAWAWFPINSAPE